MKARNLLNMQGWFLVLLITSMASPLHARKPCQHDWSTEMAQELLGSHFDLIRGWAYSNEQHVCPTNLPAAQTADQNTLNITLPNITVPCWRLGVFGFTFFSLVEPCGTVKIPSEGLNFTTPFGVYYLPGVNHINLFVGRIDNAFAEYTSYAVAIGLLLYGIHALVVPSRRRLLLEKIKKVTSGELVTSKNEKLTPEEQKHEDEAAHDPQNAKFVAPGNIYRLMSVMHPDEIGFKEWSTLAGRAFLCAYMQFYLPYEILTNIFQKWDYNGVKSPLYFLCNFGSFFSQFAAFGQVCTMFAHKCAIEVESDARAWIYLLTHTEEPPKESEADALAVLSQGLEEAGDKLEDAAPAFDLHTWFKSLQNEPADSAGSGGSKVDPLLATKEATVEAAKTAEQAVEASCLTLIRPPRWLVELHECLWACFNMLLTCGYSIMLMITMFLKVATFQGDVINIAVVAVSLYFVFDLDVKILDTNPKLSEQYRHKVKKQKVKTGKDIPWIRKLASHTVAIINISIPFGLLVIVLISWREAHGTVIIGGDPFRHNV